MAPIKFCQPLSGNRKSTAVASIQYDPGSQTLSVSYVNGRHVYDYHSVDQETYEDFCRAGSKGKFVNYVIKAGYSFSRR